MNNLKNSIKNLKINGNRKENSLLMRTFKTKSIEQQPNRLGIISTKGLTKTNPCGSRANHKFPNQSTENSIKTFSRTRATLWLGHISRLKETLISQAWCTFLKGLLTINSRNFMTKRMKWNYSWEEFWWMINLRICYQNTWTLSRP